MPTVITNVNQIAAAVKALYNKTLNRIGIGTNVTTPTGLVELQNPTEAGVTLVLQDNSDDMQNTVLLKTPDLDHGVTTIMPTTAFMGFHPATKGTNAANGGGGITGISDNVSMPGIYIYAIKPENDSVGALSLNSAKPSGTGATSITKYGILVDIKNYGTSLLRVWGDGDICKERWQDYSGTSTITGWDTGVAFSKYIGYKLVGKTLHVQFGFEGTSNSDQVNFTLPYHPWRDTDLATNCLAIGIGQGSDYVNHVANIYSAGDDIIAMSFDLGASNSWESTGSKRAYGNFTCQIE